MKEYTRGPHMKVYTRGPRMKEYTRGPRVKEYTRGPRKNNVPHHVEKSMALVWPFGEHQVHI